MLKHLTRSMLGFAVLLPLAGNAVAQEELLTLDEQVNTAFATSRVLSST